MWSAPSIGRGEVIVIRFDGVADFAQLVSWNYAEQLLRLHAVFRV